MFTALTKCGLSRWLAIAFIAIVVCGGIRQLAADDAATNPPAASDDVVSDWPTPTGSAKAAKLYDQIVRQQFSDQTLPMLLTAAMAVILTLAGYGLIEIGLTRPKNFVRVWLRYLLICPLVGLAFWGYGFALGWGNWFNGPVPVGMYASLGEGVSLLDGGLGIGADPATPGVFKYGLLGTKGFCLRGIGDPSVITLFLFMIPFLVTAAIIPIGALAERWRWKTSLLYGLWVILPYSICANWLWAGGWLAQEGLNWGLGHGAVDFAGSGVVYAVGGIIALAGCVVIGPRVGRRPGDVPKTSHEYDLRAVVIGTAILIVPWGGIPPGTAITLIVVNTAWSTFTGALGAALFLKLRGMPVDTATVCKGLLAGLVAITASCPFVDAIGAAIIGAVGGMFCVLSLSFWQRRGVDDAVGAVSVFGTSGIWGVVAVGLFANGRVGEGWGGVVRPAFVEMYGNDAVRGLFYGDPSQLAAQLLAAGVLIAFGFTMAYTWFRLSNWMAPMPASNEAE